MEITNSDLLLQISVLKNEIEDQIHLCSNVSKLGHIDGNSLLEIVNSTEEKIDKLKRYQKIILKRNADTNVMFKDMNIKVKDLIKLKEGLLLKKNLKNILINIPSENDKLIEISLEAFQAVQEYKKDLSLIHEILNDFNNIQFNLEEHE